MSMVNHSRSLLLSPPTPIKPKYCSNKNFPISSNIHLQRKSFTINIDERNSGFTRRSHPPTLVTPPAAAEDDSDAGIGILEFFEGKNIFITGGTGFLGKVFVEKMLRSTSVGKVYLLIKAKDKEAAFDRIQNEIINSELFTLLQEKHGKFYGDFVREKLIPIVGDICEPNLGMDYESIDLVRKNVNVIIQSAANTTYFERYDVIFDTNVIAPQRLMRFAKTCHKLQLFTHVSTAYVNDGEGVILEKPLTVDDGVGVAVDLADEISLLLKSPTMLSPYDATNFFKQLGKRRAKTLGWSNTYQLTKAMGEMAVNEIRGDVRLLIIRPSIVESCYCEPLPGWIQGYRMADPVIISYGKGHLPGYFGNPHVSLDLIPADLVVNTIIAAIANHGGTNVVQPNVYHIASSVSNPITLLDFFNYQYEYFNTTPLVEGANKAKVEFFDNFDEFSKFPRDEIFRHYKGDGEDKKMIRRYKAKVEYAEQLCKGYEFAGFFKARFDTSNTQKLIEKMSNDEQLNFGVDVRNIDWKKYLMDIHIPGLKKYLDEKILIN